MIEKVREAYYDYVKNTGKLPRFLFIDKKSYNLLIKNYYFLSHTLTPGGKYMGMGVIEVLKPDFIWVG